MINHRSYTHNLNSWEINPEKKLGLNGIRTHVLCDSGAMLYQLSYQFNWELATLWVRNVPVKGKEYIEDITWWREDMNFIFECQEYCSCYENIEFISSS